VVTRRNRRNAPKI